jgi:hypothetical protein
MVPICLEFQLLWLKIHILFLLSIELDNACFDILYKINQGDRSNPKKKRIFFRKGIRIKKNGIQDTTTKNKLVFLILK